MKKKATNVNMCEKLKKQLVTFHSQYGNKITHIVLTLLNSALCMVQSVVSYDLCFFLLWYTLRYGYKQSIHIQKEI